LGVVVTLLTWLVVIIVVAAVAAAVGVLLTRSVKRGSPRVPDALERLPSRRDQPVAYSDGRPVTEADEPPAEAKDEAAFEQVLREELDEVRGEEETP
jgi:hypothetical protein